MIFQHAEHRLFHPQKEIHQHAGGHVMKPAAPVELVILEARIDAVEHKAKHTRNHHFTALSGEKGFQPVVGQRRIFDKNLPDDADPHLGGAIDRNRFKFTGDLIKILPHLTVGNAAPLLELGAEPFDLPLDDPFGCSLRDFIGPGLVGKQHDEVAVDERGDHLADQRQRHLKAGICLQPREVGRDHRQIAVARLGKRLAQQMNVVGSAAAAAGLAHDQRSFGKVVVSAVQCVDHLSDDHQGGVAGVVMDKFQPLFDDRVGAVLQNLHMISRAGHQLLDEGKMDRQHHWYQDGVGIPHLPGENDMPLAAADRLAHREAPSFWRCCCSTAAKRLRRRIFTAPRLVISSILIWV